jgi:cell shape-determining protein MreC
MKNFSSRTRESSPRNYRERIWWKPLLWVIGAFLVLFFAKGILSTVAGAVTTPFFFLRHYIETSSATVPSFFRSRVELLSQVQSLEAQIQGEEGRDAAFALLKEENEDLKNLFLGSTTSPNILAGVISRPPYTPYDTLIIDKGADDGVTLYAPVYFGKKVGGGYIRSVSHRTALVTLFSSPGAESTVYVFGPDIFTSAHGEGGGVVRISIPQGMPVEKGNVVVLPSLGAGILGTVDHVRSVPTEPEQHAYVIFDIPLQSIRIVSVGTSPVRSVPFEEAQEAVEVAEERLFTVEIPAEYQVGSTTLGVGGVSSSSTTTP